MFTAAAILSFIKQHRTLVFYTAMFLLIVTGTLALVATAYHRGVTDTLQKQAVIDARSKMIDAMTKYERAEVTTKLTTAYVDRVSVVHSQGATILKEVPVYVTPANDDHCTIPPNFSVLWNGANRGELPATADAVNAPASPGVVPSFSTTDPATVAAQ